MVHHDKYLIHFCSEDPNPEVRGHIDNLWRCNGLDKGRSREPYRNLGCVEDRGNKQKHSDEVDHGDRKRPVQLDFDHKHACE